MKDTRNYDPQAMIALYFLRIKEMHMKPDQQFCNVKKHETEYEPEVCWPT